MKNKNLLQTDLIYKGVASIRIEYDQGDITVFHGDDNTVLASWKEPDDVNDHWDIFWNLINDQVKQNNGFRIGG
mgnify:CR=1 FL=1|tara:strand:+ start:274 stop:495 length:222 start_codon:yes stop_codon:yes gene_type:complete